MTATRLPSDPDVVPKAAIVGFVVGVIGGALVAVTWLLAGRCV